MKRLPTQKDVTKAKLHSLVEERAYLERRMAEGGVSPLKRANLVRSLYRVEAEIAVICKYRFF